MFVTAELCQMSFFGGWPAAFYLYGELFFDIILTAAELYFLKTLPTQI